MNVLVSNATPFVVWRVSGGLVGACRSQADANEIIWSLKTDFPHNDYFCKDIDGQITTDTRGEIIVSKVGSTTITEDDNGGFRLYRNGALTGIHGTEQKAQDAAAAALTPRNLR